jgi:hypothetical protein
MVLRKLELFQNLRPRKDLFFWEAVERCLYARMHDWLQDCIV